MTPSDPELPRVLSPRDILKFYFDNGFRVVFWPAIADRKGPREENWQHTLTTIDSYHEGNRSGLVTGVEIAPGHFYHDVDIDWGPGADIALALIPLTDFVYGRKSKKYSHLGYTLPEAVPFFKYEDPVDGQCLIELRGTKIDGGIGLQNMAPPSVWSDEHDNRELLEFSRMVLPAHLNAASVLQQSVRNAAIAMLLARRLGPKGFGHDVRNAFAGFLLRLDVTEDEIDAMGKRLLAFCGNEDKKDIRQSIDSARKKLAAGKRVTGGPWLAKHFGGRDGKLIIARINSWLGRDDFIRSSNGIIVKDSQDNIRRAVEQLNVTLSRNEFSEKVLIQEDEGGPSRTLEDGPNDELWLRIDREFHFRPSEKFFLKVIRSLARENSFHPVRDYLESLRWDSTPRINTWLATYGGAVDETANAIDAKPGELTYLQAVSSIVLMAAVKRIFEPGCKYDEMLVLESVQGMNKSTALRVLCVEDAWFSDDLPLNVGSQELIERTLGKWIIEASDLSGKRKAENEQLKASMSRQVDGPARMAYAHLPVERPRHFILIGTTNSDNYLADSTGARRFWPVKIDRFEVKALKRDRDQLWAEAVVRVKKGESIRLPEVLWPAAAEQQEQRRTHEPWEDILREFLDSDDVTLASGDSLRHVQTDILWTTLGFIDVKSRDTRGAQRISEVMQRLGFERAKLWSSDLKKMVVGYSEKKKKP